MRAGSVGFCRRLGLLLFCGVGCLIDAWGADLRVTPAAISWDEEAWVEVVVSNIAPGAAVELSLLVDVDRDGSPGDADCLLRLFALQDGVTNGLKSRVIPDDDDAVADGVIRTRVSYYGLHGAAPLYHAAGRYLWVGRTSGGGLVVAPFAVTQDVSAVTWISGQVQDWESRAGVPGALVLSHPFAAHRGLLPPVYADTNGEFTVYVPPGYPVDNLAGFSTVAAGALMAARVPDGSQFSEMPLTNEPTAGANMLGTPLLVTSGQGVTDLVQAVSGHVYDGNTNPLAGVWVASELADGDDDGDVWSIAVSDTNGAFELHMPIEAAVGVFTVPDLLNERGLSATWQEVAIGTTAVSNVDLFCGTADALVRVAVASGPGDVPVPGMMVEAEGDAGVAQGHTLDDGVCDLVVRAGTYQLDPEEDAVEAGGYAPFTESGSAGAVAGGSTSVVLRLRAGSPLAGHVYDRRTNALAWGEVEAYLPASWDGLGGALANRQGAYELMVATGAYRVVADGFDGYIGQVYSNYYTWEWDNGPRGDPVHVGTSGVHDIDFLLERGALIAGTVCNSGGEPLNAEVTAYAPEGDEVDRWWGWRAQTDTGPEGRYVLTVPAGTNYRVAARAEGFLEEVYDGFYAHQYNEATPVATGLDGGATNVDFALDAPGWIRGVVRVDGVPAGGIDVELRWVEDRAAPWDSLYFGTESSDSNGVYGLACPPGSNYVVRAQPAAGSFLVEEYWSNALIQTEARQLTVPPQATVSGIDFDLEEGMRVTGVVVDENGAGLAGTYVNANYADTNGVWWYGGGASTEEDGSYAFSAPTGRVYFVSASPPSDSWYPTTYYRDVFTADAAVLIATNRGETVSGVDFHMQPGYRLYGCIYRADGVTPVDGGYVGCVDTNEHWINGIDADGSGYYICDALPTNMPIYVRGSGSGCVDEYYEDAYRPSDAMSLRLAPLTTARVDFVLYGWTDDSDADGLLDQFEDSRPDGRYVPGEDWASYTNRDTDGDRLDDPVEQGLGTSPWRSDTDEDHQSDYEEHVVLGTQPTNRQDCMKCVDMLVSGNDVALTWTSVPGKTNYWIERCWDLSGSNWMAVEGPLSGSGSNTTTWVVEDGFLVTNTHYRVYVPY